MPKYTLNEPPAQEFVDLFRMEKDHNNESRNRNGQMGAMPLQSISTMSQTLQVPNLRKNLKFLEENIEIKKLELEILEDLVLVQRWADYSQKYGIGYKMTNGDYGVLFND